MHLYYLRINDVNIGKHVNLVGRANRFGSTRTTDVSYNLKVTCCQVCYINTAQTVLTQSTRTFARLHFNPIRRFSTKSIYERILSVLSVLKHDVLQCICPPRIINSGMRPYCEMNLGQLRH